MDKTHPSDDARIFGIGKNIFFAGLVSFLTDTSTKMVYCIMPMFLLSIGASKTTLSLIEGIAESTSSVLKALSGFWSDRIGRNKPFMLIGYAATAIVTPVYAAAGSSLHVLLLRFLERIGKGIRTAPRDSLIAGSSGDGRTGRGFGFHKAMDNSGAIAGPMIAFLVLSMFHGNFRTVFLLATIPAVIGVCAIVVFIKEARKSKAELLHKFRIRDFSRRYYFFLAIAFVFTLGNSTDALLLVKANDIGIKVTYIPLVYLIFNSVSVLFSTWLGILSDRIGKEKLIIAGFLIYAAVYFGFGRTSEKTVVVMLFALYGLYTAAADGAQKALVSDLIPKNKRGTGLGIYNSLLGITLLPASLIAGILYDKVNSSVPFYFGSATAGCAAMLMAVFYFTKKRSLPHSA